VTAFGRKPITIATSDFRRFADILSAQARTTGFEQRSRGRLQWDEAL